MRKDIANLKPQTNGTTNATTNGHAADLDVEVLIIGAGFGGVYMLHKLREQGFQCKVMEAGPALGGIWHWNCYPGARVDSMAPVYEYSIEKVWKDWTWTERYPNWEELRAYFDHVDKTLDISKDVFFNTRVVGADFDRRATRWVVKTEDGRTARAKYLIVCAGFAAKRLFPEWPGLDTFEGEMHHSSFWPQEGVDTKGKRIAVIGTGATGIQLAQECAKDAASVTVFQRTPNLCLPMRQKPLTKEEQDAKKKTYPEFYKSRMTTFAGFQFDFSEKDTFDDDPEAREKFYEELWELGGFRFWVGTYKDLFFSMDGNRKAYDFWAKKTRARISDPVKRDLLAPLEPPHAFGTKRPSLEQNFYEMMDRPENEIVDIKKTPIKEVSKTGIVTEDGKLREYDIIALCTGFDSVTGGMKSMGLRSIEGVDLADKWKDGAKTYLGMSIAGFPNMFYLYGTQGPTAFSNGPSCVECQGDWIVDAMVKLKEEGIDYIVPSKEAEDKWKDHIDDISNKTLFPLTSSWYMGANVPGKKVEQLNYAGGIPKYEEDVRASLNNGFEGFITA